MRKILLVIVVAFSLCGCDDFLDIKPKGVSLLDNTEILDKIMNSSKVAAYDTKTFYMLDDIDVPDGLDMTNFKPEIANRVYDFRVHTVGDESDVDFETSWQCIDRCNQVLDNVDQSVGPEMDKRRIKGEALSIRAHAYYNLISMYCPPYTKETATNENTGLPLRLKHDVKGSYKRNTLEEVMEQIIKDLEESLPLLPDMATNNETSSKVMAQGYLVRTYMMKGDYANALKHAKDAVQIHDKMFDYNKLDPNAPLDGLPERSLDHPEIIFNQSSHTGTAPRGYFFQFNRCFFTPELLSFFGNNEDDFRFKYFVINNPKFPNRKTFIGSIMGEYHAGILTGELLLNLAECEARVGEFSKAVELVNQVRKHRFKAGSDYELSAVNKEQALEIVMGERRRELCFTKARFLDVRRLNALHTANIKIDRNALDGERTIVAPNANEWTLQIPKKILNLSPEFTPNPR